MTPALVVGAQTAGLGVVRALGRRGVPVFALHYKATDVAQRSRYATEAVAVSAPDRDESRFVDELLALGDRLGGGLLIPTADEAVVAVSRQYDALATRFTLACTPWEVTETFIEKRRTYALADAIGVACPRTIVPMCREDALAYAAGAAFPCLVKPSRGDQFVARFGVKMFLVADRHELVARYDLATAAGCEVVLQEFVGGPDDAGVNYNSYWGDGEPLVEFTAAKVRGGPPFVGSPRVLVSRRVPEVIEPGRAILKAMGFSGYACTEFKRDARDGRYKLMEVNGRHNLSTALAVRCGIDFPWLQYRHLAHGEVPAPAEFAEGVYWIDLLRDVGYSLTRFRAERYAVRNYVRPYLGRPVYAIPSWDDPAPFARELWSRWARKRAVAVEPVPAPRARPLVVLEPALATRETGT
jgi:predicted ATP-grasp superfamily ATP-dependent carboligase